MNSFRKKIIVLSITFLGVLGLLNVSVQFGNILDFFPGISLSLLLAEEVTETSCCDKDHNSFAEVELYIVKHGYVIHHQIVNKAVGVYLHSVDIPLHPAFEKVTPPPKA